MKLGETHMSEWKTVRVKQELVTAATRTLEKDRYRSLSEFVSEAIRLRLEELKKSREAIAETQTECLVIPERLRYTPTHLWAMVTPEGNISVGLSDYAQRRLEGAVALQTDPIGCEVKKGEPFGVVETWMFMFDLFSPVSGKIIRLNKVLQDNPSAINDNPHETTWIAEIRPDNLITLEEELVDLMRPPKYKDWVEKLDRPRILGV